MANARICDRCGSVAKVGTPDYEETHIISLSKINTNGFAYDLCAVCAGEIERWLDGKFELRPKGWRGDGDG